MSGRRSRSARRSSSRGRPSNNGSSLRFRDKVEVIPDEGRPSFRRSPAPRASSALSESRRARAMRMPRDARGRFLPLNSGSGPTYRKTPAPNRYGYRLPGRDAQSSFLSSDSESEDVVPSPSARRRSTRGARSRSSSGSSSGTRRSGRSSRRDLQDTPRPPKILRRRTGADGGGPSSRRMTMRRGHGGGCC